MEAMRKGLLVLTALLILATAVLSALGQAGFDLMALLAAGLSLCAALIVNSPRGGILATAMLCLSCNIYLFKAKLDIALGPSRCAIGTLFDCDKVNTSPASEINGIPITIFGGAFYAALAMAALGSDKRFPRFFQTNALFAIVSLTYSLYLAYQSKLLGTVCIVCATMYVGNALLLWAGIKGMRQTKTSLSQNLGGILGTNSFVTISAAFAALVLFGLMGYRQLAVDPLTNISPEKARDKNFLAGLYATPNGTVTLDGTEHIFGKTTAPYTLVEWADFTCGHCARSLADIKQVIQERPEIKLYFKPFPRSAACNPVLQHNAGPMACDAAFAAECAGQQGKFWEMTTILFANMNYLDPVSIKFMAEQVGVDADKFQQCLDDPKTGKGIEADARAGAEAGVIGTPAFF
ncbi:MAG: thioredoxin domain-containing protein, partial [Proteobacteria bacterium]|nr:thioredoxin domain-containing protein [Pseudomonadota bacterium]